METLEDRRLLSVTAAEFSSIYNAYPEFSLPSTLSSFTSNGSTARDIAAADLSVANIKSAIAAAKATPGDDLIVVRTTNAKNTITFAAATDIFTVDFNSTDSTTYGTCCGSVTIVALGDAPLTINANSKNAAFSFTGQSIVNLANITITGGNNTSTGGGAIYAAGAMCNLSNMTLAGNMAAGSGGSCGRGGAVYVVDSSLNFKQIIFDNNSASREGGAFYSGSYSNSVLSDVDFVRNSAPRGGAIYTYSGTVTIEGTALPQTSDSRDTPSSLSGSRFYYNSATYSGGGIYGGTDVTITNTLFVNNSASEGAGIYYYGYDSNLTIKNSRVINNTATSIAGGIYYYGKSANIYNSEISGNSAGTGAGGGLYVKTDGCTLYNVTIAGNTAETAGGLYVFGIQSGKNTATLNNTIVLGNTANSAVSDIILTSYGFVQGYNNLTSTASWVSGNSGNNLTSSSPTAVFVSPSSKNFSLKSGSIAIDAGSASYLSSILYPIDVAGNTRKYNGTIDIGAYEYVGPTTTALTGIALSTSAPTIGTAITATISPAGATATYQWSYCSTSTGSFTNISGATSKSYTPTSAYVGYYLRCTATGTGNYSGTQSATTTSTVAALRLMSVSLSTQSPKEGEQIRAIPVPSIASATYQWYYGSTQATATNLISGVSTAYFTPTSAYVGYYLKCVATGTGDYTGTAYVFTSSPVAAATTTTALTSISLSTSAPAVGTAITATVSPSGATATYQWSYGSTSMGTFTNISGAIYSSYTPTSDYIGKYIRCTATGTGSYTGTKYSTTSSTVTETLAIPTLSASATGTNSISVTVGSVSNVYAYSLQYATNSSFTNATIIPVSSGVNSITGLAANTTYYLRVKAVGTGDYSDSSYSAAVLATTGKTTLSAPTLKIPTVSGTTVSASWSSVTNAASYTLEYKLESAASWTAITGLTTTSTSFTGAAGSTYEIRVKAVGSGSYSDSAYSATQSVALSQASYQTEIQTRIVLTTEKGAGDEAANLPTGVSSIRNGQTVFAEIWMKNVDATDPAIVGGYLNLIYNQTSLQYDSVAYGSIYNTFTGEEDASNAGIVSTLGGAAATGVLNKGDDEWVRLVTVSFVALEEGTTTLSLAKPQRAMDNFTRSDGVTLNAQQIDFGSTTLIVEKNCPMDIDGDGYIGLSDYTRLSAAWRTSSGDAKWNADCDIDGDGYVGLSDYTFLSKNWRKYTTDPTLVYPAAPAAAESVVAETVVAETPFVWLPCAELVDAFAAAPITIAANSDANPTTPVISEAAETTVDVVLTAVTQKSASDTANAVPASISDYKIGDTFYLEVWVKNSKGDSGITGGYLNLNYSATL